MPLRTQAFICLNLMFLCACDEAQQKQKTVVATKLAGEIPAWLTPSDVIEPSLWLRSKEVGHEVLTTDPEVDRLRRAMQQATVRFFEDQRMIANRTVQTADMLAESRQPERYVDILTGLIDVADISSGKKLYGEMCQHYLNIRKANHSRSEALEKLAVSYQEKSSE